MNVGIISRFVLTRKLLRTLLSTAPDIQVIFEAPSLQEGEEVISKLCPGVVLVDSPASGEALAAIRQLGKLFPQAKVVLLTEGENEEFILRAIMAGAHGCVSKNSDPQVIPRALNHVERGEFWVSHEIANLITGKWLKSQHSGRDTQHDLTQREWEILALLAEGQVNKEIATRLSIAENTVKAHLAVIYRKLGVTTRFAAALHFFRQTNHNSPRPVSSESSPRDPLDPEGSDTLAHS